MKHPERELQKSCLTILFREYPEGFVFHVPNGEKRDPRTGYMLKLLGVKPGIHDLPVVRPFSRMGWLELKDETGVLSKVQKDIHAEFEKRGHKTDVIRSVDELRVIIQRWKIEDGTAT